MLKILLRTFLSWISFAVTITCMSAIIFISLQQYMRSSIDDLLANTTTSIKDNIVLAQDPSKLDSPTKTELSKIKSISYILYSKDSKALATNIKDVDNYKLDKEILEVADRDGKNSITWQPISSLRLAARITPFSESNGGYIVVANSISSIQEFSEVLLKNMAVGTGISLLLVFFVLLLVNMAQSPLEKLLMLAIAKQKEKKEKQEKQQEIKTEA
jgi:hypothetical protein